jgi:hypothetical protein
MRLTGAWSRAEADAFLTEQRVPIRLAVRTGPDGDGLWMLSLWYRWLPDRAVFECATNRRADVVGHLERHDGVAFEVSTNEPPYRGVRGAGTATIEPDRGQERLRDLLERYLGGTDSRLAEELLSPDREEVRIVVEPDRLYSWDFTERMREDGESGG